MIALEIVSGHRSADDTLSLLPQVLSQSQLVNLSRYPSLVRANAAYNSVKNTALSPFMKPLGKLVKSSDPVPHYLYEKTVLSNSDYSKSPRRRSKSHKSTAKVDSSCPPSPSTRRSPTRQHRSHDSRVSLQTRHSLTPPPRSHASESPRRRSLTPPRSRKLSPVAIPRKRSLTPPLSRKAHAGQTPRYLPPTLPPLNKKSYGDETRRHRSLTPPPLSHRSLTPPPLTRKSFAGETPRRREAGGGVHVKARSSSSRRPLALAGGDQQVRSKSRQRFNSNDCVVSLPLKSALAGNSRRGKTKVAQKVAFATEAIVLCFKKHDPPASLWHGGQ